MEGAKGNFVLERAGAEEQWEEKTVVLSFDKNNKEEVQDGPAQKVGWRVLPVGWEKVALGFWFLWDMSGDGLGII